MTNLQDFAYRYLEESSNKAMDAKGSIFLTVEEIVDSVLSFHKQGTLNDDRQIESRKQVSKIAKKYLSNIRRSKLAESSCVEKIQEDITIMAESSPKDTLVLMTAHQPNLFPYPGVLRKIALLWAVRERILKKTDSRLDVVCFYGIADHDFANNKWVRSAEIVSPLRREGTLRLNVKLESNQRYLPSNIVPKPSNETLAKWKSQIESWLLENASLALKSLKTTKTSSLSIADAAKSSFESFWTQVIDAHELSSSLSDFNSTLLALLVTSVWEVPIVFANFSDCFPIFGEEYKWVLDHRGEFAQLIEQNETQLRAQGVDTGLAENANEIFPLWVKCGCGSKFRLNIGQTGVSGKCLRCATENSLEFVELERLALSKPDLLEPRSVSMPIVFSRGMGISCYIGGVGSLGYLMHTRQISEKLSSQLPPTPFWYVTDVCDSLTNLALRCEIQRIARTYSLVVAGQIESAALLLEELKNKVAAGQIRKGPVTERDSQLLERIALYANGNASMIDYVVNVGLRSTWDQWLEFLMNDGRLQIPVGLKWRFSKR